MKARTFRTLAAAALAGLALTACNDTNETDQPHTRVALQISAGVHTRATGSTWAQGDAIGVYMLAPGTTTPVDGQANFAYTNTAADGTHGTFAPADAGKTAYYPTSGSDVDITAYYPHAAVIANREERSGKQTRAASDATGLLRTKALAMTSEQQSTGLLTIDASSQSDLPAIDLMTAERVTANQEAPEVALEFEHRMAKVVVTLEAGAGAEGLDLTSATVTLRGTPQTAVFDLFAQAFESFGEAGDIRLTSAPTAIVVPTAAGKGVGFSVEAGGKVFSAALPGDVALDGGTETTVLITLKIEEGGQSSASITATIKPWVEGPEVGLDAVDIVITHGEMDVDPLISAFSIWKNTDVGDVREYTLSGSVWESDNPLLKSEVAEGDAFTATATIGDADVVTAIKDDLRASATATAAGAVSLAFEHLNAQVEFVLERASGLTVDLTGATIDLGEYTGFVAGTEYLIDAKDWSGTAIMVKTSGGKTYKAIADFTTAAGQKTALTLTLKPTEAAGIKATILGWSTPVDTSGEAELSGISIGANSLGTLDPGVLNITTGTLTGKYKWDGTDLTTITPLYWDNLDSSGTHTFALEFTPDGAGTPALDILEGKATNVSWGAEFINFGELKHRNAKLTVELVPGTGYTAGDLNNATLELHGFTGASAHPMPLSERSSTAIVAPAALTAVHKLTATIGGNTYTIVLKDVAAFGSKFEGNTAYALKAKVNKAGIGGIIAGTGGWTDSNPGTGDFGDDDIEVMTADGLGSFEAGEFTLTTGGTDYVYDWDGTLTPVGDRLFWGDLSSSTTHDFTLQFVPSAAGTPEQDVQEGSATGVAWGEKPDFGTLAHVNAKLTVKLEAGDGFTESTLSTLVKTVTLSGFPLTPYTMINGTGTEGFAIIAPATLTADHKLVLKWDTHEYTLKLKDSFSAFSANTEYVLKAKVNMAGISGITVTIAGWKTDGNDKEGSFD